MALGEERAVARGGGELVGRTRFCAGGDDEGEDIIVLTSEFSSIGTTLSQQTLHPASRIAREIQIFCSQWER